MMEEKGTNNGKKDRIGVVLYGLYLLLIGLSVVLIVKLAGIQLFYSPDPGLRKALSPKVTCRTTHPVRGNIYDCKGRLLAISCPTYQIAMDCSVRRDEFARNKKGDSLEMDWRAKAEMLSKGLARYLPGKSADAYYKEIMSARRAGKHYTKFGNPVDRNTYLKIRELPLFNEGANRGGLIAERREVRRYPYGSLAARTIGFKRDSRIDVGNRNVGLEGKFDYILHGTEGKEYFRKTDYGMVHDNDSTDVQARDGDDLYTTIDIDYQMLADKAVHKYIDNENDLEGACLVLMEVSTGAIRAMVNLSRDPGSNGAFSERANLAVGRAAEPGSVFKTVTLMSVLSDGYVKNLDETLPTNHGIIEGTRNKPDQHIVDYERNHHTKRISVLDGFKMSSNYVFGTLAVKNYGKKPMQYIDNINSYKLADCFDFDLDGLAKPLIPSPKTMKYWTNTDLGCIGFGYTTRETPLHLLTFYNAIAGKGRMMKPYLVEYIGKNGCITSRRGPGVLNSSICTHAVADTLNRALKTVTAEGTGRRLKNSPCEIAGKTGTSFGTMNIDGKTVYSDSDGRRIYQGTFCGYFPAEDPQYSVICVVYSKPTHKSFQGGTIPALAIGELVQGIYNIDPYFRKKI